MNDKTAPHDEIRIGVSACLLGHEVRYNGGHKHDRFLTETVGRFVTFVPVCPEFDIGLGVPRETLRLQQSPDGTRLVAPASGLDHTDRMQAHARRQVAQLARANLSGFILKKDSPSCGLHRVKLYGPSGMPVKSGRGLFAAQVVQGMPHLPVEEEGRLNDPRLRENFFERVFAYRRLQDLFRGRWRMGDLVAFHTREKLLLLAHEEQAYRRLGRLVAAGKALSPSELADQYQREFLGALAHKATPRRHVNVLQHMAGYFKAMLTADEKQEFGRILDDYKAELLPLIVPVTLMRHFVTKYGQEYLAAQSYLDPHPKELMLRNHA